jgi:hypothetical protein
MLNRCAGLAAGRRSMQVSSREIGSSKASDMAEIRERIRE